MSRQTLILIITTLVSLCDSGQDSLGTKLTGKWGICYSLDSVDTLCNNPFNYYTLDHNGRFQHGEVIISDKKIPVTGIWKYENGNIELVYDKHPNYSYSNQIFREIIFITTDLFYCRVLDKIENPGHWVFYSFKRMK